MPLPFLGMWLQETAKEQDSVTGVGQEPNGFMSHMCHHGPKYKQAPRISVPFALQGCQPSPGHGTHPHLSPWTLRENLLSSLDSLDL